MATLSKIISVIYAFALFIIIVFLLSACATDLTKIIAVTADNCPNGSWSVKENQEAKIRYINCK